MPDCTQQKTTPADVQGRLKRLQKIKGLSDDAIAAKIGVGKLTWRRSILGQDSRGGRGKEFANLLEVLLAVRREFGVSWRELLGPDED
jgi:transcriptional regulator with XRE-family HTH domain